VLSDGYWEEDIAQKRQASVLASLLIRHEVTHTALFLLQVAAPLLPLHTCDPTKYMSQTPAHTPTNTLGSATFSYIHGSEFLLPITPDRPL